MRPPEVVAPEVRIVAVKIGQAIRGARGLSPVIAAAVPRAARLALALAHGRACTGT
jgi:hypothetical protein